MPGLIHLTDQRLCLECFWPKLEVKSKGILGLGKGTKIKDIDLDLSCFMFSKSMSNISTVYFRQATSQYGLQLSPDDFTGGEDNNAPNEYCQINTLKFPCEPISIVFTLNTFTKPRQFFSDLRFISFKLVNDEACLHKGEYNNLKSSHNAIIGGIMVKTTKDLVFIAGGQTGEGHNMLQLEALAKSALRSAIKNNRK